LRAEALAIPDLLVRIREHPDRTTNTVDNGHERTASVYEHFLQSQPGNELERLARIRMAYHLAEIAVNCMENGYFPAIHQLAKAFVNGDSLRHLLSVIRRGLLARYKKIKKNKQAIQPDN